MKRYITVALRDANLVLSVINNMSTAIRNGNDAYHWLKTQIDNRQISHNDQHANHHKELPHQGGFVSFYIDPHGGVWMQVEH